MEYTLIGRKERNIQIPLRNLALPSFPLLPTKAMRSRYKLPLLAAEQQGVNQSWFTQCLCEAFIWSFLPSSPAPSFVKVNHFLRSPVVVNFTPFFSLWRALGVNGTRLGTIVVSGCLLVKLRDACGKKVESGEIWEMRLGNKLKWVSF